MFLFLNCTAPFQIQSCMHSSWQRLKFGKITVSFGEYRRENCSLKYSDSPQTLWQCKHNEGLVLIAHHAGVFFYLFRISGRVVYLLVVSHSAGLSKQLLWSLAARVLSPFAAVCVSVWLYTMWCDFCESEQGNKLVKKIQFASVLCVWVCVCAHVFCLCLFPSRHFPALFSKLCYHWVHHWWAT